MADKLTIRDLKPDKRNPRKHPPRNLEMIRRSLSEVGAARSIVVDEEDNVLVGHGVIEAAAQAGIERVRVVEADGNEIVAVRRTGLTEEQKRKVAYYDNRSAELAEWLPEQVKLDVDAGLDLSGIFTETELSLVEQDNTLPSFKEYDESVEDEVEYITCPKCGHRWPK